MTRLIGSGTTGCGGPGQARSLGIGSGGLSPPHQWHKESETSALLLLIDEGLRDVVVAVKTVFRRGRVHQGLFPALPSWTPLESIQTSGAWARPAGSGARTSRRLLCGSWDVGE